MYAKEFQNMFVDIFSGNTGSKRVNMGEKAVYYSLTETNHINATRGLILKKSIKVIIEV